MSGPFTTSRAFTPDSDDSDPLMDAHIEIDGGEESEEAPAVKAPSKIRRAQQTSRKFKTDFTLLLKHWGK